MLSVSSRPPSTHKTVSGWRSTTSMPFAANTLNALSWLCAKLNACAWRACHTTVLEMGLTRKGGGGKGQAKTNAPAWVAMLVRFAMLRKGLAPTSSVSADIANIAWGLEKDGLWLHFRHGKPRSCKRDVRKRLGMLLAWSKFHCSPGQGCSVSEIIQQLSLFAFQINWLKVYYRVKKKDKQILGGTTGCNLIIRKQCTSDRSLA